jgi:hypothetical protein
LEICIEEEGKQTGYFNDLVSSKAEEIQMCCIHAEAVAVHPRRGRNVGFHDAMDTVRLDIPTAEGEAVLARVAAGQQEVTAVYFWKSWTCGRTTTLPASESMMPITSSGDVRDTG